MPAPVTPPPITRTSKSSLPSAARLYARTVDDNGCILHLRPLHRALDGTLPVIVELVALIGAHVRLEGAVDGPMLGYFLLATPEVCCQAGEVGSAQGRSFSNLWPLYRDTENICLELHEQVIDDCTAIDTQGWYVDTAISSHCLQHV